MATTTKKNFKAMSTKKLNALLETASEKDKKTIQAELDLRVAAQVAAEEEAAIAEAEETLLTPEEEAAIAEAEKNGGLNPLYDKNAAKAEKAEHKPKRTEEELKALADECRKNVGHKCEVVPFNTATYVPGVINSILADKRAGNVLYVVKTDDGRTVRKACNSSLIKISEEVVEMVAKKRGRQAGERERLSEKDLQDKLAQAAENIGRVLTYGEGDNAEAGRIISVVLDKRVDMVLYKISVFDENGESKKIVHKSAFGNVPFTIAEDIDEEGQKMHDAYFARRERRDHFEALSPEDRYNKVLEAEKKAQEAFERAQANLEKAKAKAAEAKATLDEALANEAKETRAEADAEDLA